MAADGTLMMEGADIRFKNFAGKEGMYNAEGDRNFCLMLDPETARQMANDGWNIKTLRKREEDDDERPYIQVSIKYRGKNGPVRPPTVVLIGSRGRTNLSEDELEILDWIDIANVDLIIRPFSWSVNGKSGIKAYLKSLYVTQDEDALALKYADVPEQNAITAGDDPVHHDDNIIEGEAWYVDDDQKAIGR